MKKSPLSILAALALLSAAPLSGQSAPPSAATYFSFLSSEDRQNLLHSNELTASGSSAAVLPFGAMAPFATELSSGLTVSGASVAIEGFFLFDRPAGNVNLAIYNAVNSVASMQGLEYYSVSQKKMEPLILASWRVAADQKTKVPDPTFTTIPAFQKAVVYQKDNKLGDGLNELTWRALPNALVMSFRNLQRLNYGILPLVDPGNLQMLFVVVPLADKVAVYGVMEAKTAKLFGLERSKDESFRSRMRALAGWLGARIVTAK